MKMGKKVREYKAGDFIFAKVKGYPAWPARVQRMNGKKYFVYFYGTGETANLPPNMIFDYAENKDKFLTKTVKRRDFNDGVKQIEYDFANNVPLEQVIGVAVEAEAPEGANVTANESTANETVDESMADTTAADETMADETPQNDTGFEDSDETGALVIDEGKQAKAARKPAAKTPAKETPKAKEAKTPRGRAKKDEEGKEEVKEDDKKEEELVSRSGRKIRPKRYIDEHTQENATLPSPAPKKRRGASPVEKDKDNKEKEKEGKEKDAKDKNIKHFNAVTQAELQDLKEPFTPGDPEKENIIICYLPTGRYVGVRLFQSRPDHFKNDAARLQWDKQAASNALTLKSQLEKGHITPQSVMAQLVMDLNLTDEEKATLDKGRLTEEKKSHVQYLKTEMKLMELDTKIKTCLCLERADTELCLEVLDELMELDIKPLMLLKHPNTLETIKRMRAYVGNTPSWELSESAALEFNQQAYKIRKRAENVYNQMKGLFSTPEGVSFWEFFTERVSQFKMATAKLTPEEVMEIVHEPLEMSLPTSYTMKASVEAANEEEKRVEDADKEKSEEPEEGARKINSGPAKSKKVVSSTPKTPAKRQSSRNKPEEKEKEETKTTEGTSAEASTEQNQEEQNKDKDSKESNEKEAKDKNSQKDSKVDIEDEKSKDDKEKDKSLKDKNSKDKNSKDKSSKDKDSKDKSSKDKDSKDKSDTEGKVSDVKEKTPDKSAESADDSKKESSVVEDVKESSKEGSKETEKEKRTDKEKSTEKEKSMEKEKSTEKEKRTEKSDKEDKKEEKEKTEDEPRAKRSRESKKTEPPPRSPTKRKSKF